MADVRALRKELGVTQVALASLLGLHQSTVSRLEGGSLPVDERTCLALEALRSRHEAAALCSICPRAAAADVAACTAVDCPARVREAA